MSQSSSESTLELGQVTIGVLTALREEYTACRRVLDPDSQGIEVERHATAGTLTCWLCFVPAKNGGKHVVAITRLPQMGNTAAAISVTLLLQHCEAISALIMCGIAGAVPNPGDPEKHVRLGDIVVSGPTGVFQYDFGKQRDPLKSKDDLFDGFEFRSPPRPPSPRLLAAVERIHADEMEMRRDVSRPWEINTKEFLDKVGDASQWKRPGKARDKLIDSPDGKGDPTPHPKDPRRRGQNPRVFHGAIGAANIVLADPKMRDLLRDRWQLRAIEMEGSGVADASWMASVGYLIVRGTCDYCNSTKNDDWHQYAAVIAAGYTRTVIEYLHVHTAQLVQTLPNNVQISAPSVSVPLNAGPPPQIDISSSEPGPTLIEQSEVGQMKYQPTLESQSAPAPMVSEASVKSASAHVAEHQMLSPDDRRIYELNERLDDLLETGNLSRTAPFVADLEKLLTITPRRGATVRTGWMLLARIEAAQLRSEKQSGRAVDVTRLKYLRMEVESVIV